MLRIIEEAYKAFRRENFEQCVKGFVVVIGSCKFNGVSM